MRKEILTETKFGELLKDEYMLHRFAFPISRTDSKNGERYLEAGDYIIPEDLNRKAVLLFNKKKADILNGLDKGCLVFSANGSPMDSGLNDKVGYLRISTNFSNDKGEIFFIELHRCSNKSRGFYADMIIDRKKEKEYNELSESIRAYNKTVRPCQMKEYPPTNHYIDRETYNSGPNTDNDFTLTNVLKYINERFGCSYTKVAVHPYMFTFDELYCTC